MCIRDRELGRAFPKHRILTSWGEKVRDTVPAAPALVVATPGAEPRVDGGMYGAAVFLDTWALLQRPDLRAVEDAFGKWMAAAALVAPHTAGGEVVVVADPALPVVQHLIRWDAPGFAARELLQRRDAGFPPAVHIALVDAPAKALDDFFEHVDLPQGTELLGPVDLPGGVNLPGEWDEAALGPAQRMLVRAPLAGRDALGKALRAGAVSRAARKQDAPLRIQVNPIDIG